MTVKKTKRAYASVTIVGRPNVGKSTLFNRLIGGRVAVVAEEAGTTRDRLEYVLDLNGYKISLVDTGGLQSKKKSTLEVDVEKQAKKGIESADIIIFLVNAIEGMTPDDQVVARSLRKTKKAVILVANKCDNQKIEQNTYELFKLGFGEPLRISAIHKQGMSDLEFAIIKALKKLKVKKTSKKDEEKNDNLRISILGRPNVGKSSLLNSILGEERVVVSDVPGTTRDPLDTEIEYKGRKITIVDTAGIRRRGKVEKGIENFSLIRTQETIERSDVSIILMDASEPVSAQDLHIIQMALEARTGIVIAVNKSDLVTADEREGILRLLRYKCDFLPWAPVHFVSAKNKKNIFLLLDSSLGIEKSRKTEITTPKLNSFLQKTVLKNVPSSTGIYKTKFFYANQSGVNPPKFICFFKNAKHLHFSYKRYIENEMRKEFGFEGTPISITFRESSPKEK